MHFIRQALFHDDEIVITYTFTDNPEHLKKTKESSLENGKKVTGGTASSYTVSSNIFSHFPPRENYVNRNTAITVLRFAFFYIFFFKIPSNTVL